MQIDGRPQSYSAMQIVLHWAIAALIIVQLIIGEDIVPAYRAMRRGTETSAADAFNADVHIYVGLAVLALAFWRLAIRIRRGVPALPAELSPAQRWIAILTHSVLYIVIFGMPITGLIAWYLDIHAAGEVHELAKPVIIVAVILHAAGALWEHFITRSDALVRMLRPGARRQA